VSATDWMLVVGLAICGFWMLGAHNRIVGLRAGIAEAWNAVDALLEQRATALAGLVQGLWDLWPNGRASLDALTAAQQQVQVAARAVRARPSRAVPVASLLSAEGALNSTVARLLNQVEADEGLHTDDDVATRMLILFELGPQLIEARQRFNQAAVVYNDAIRQFPTSLLAPVFRFDRAGSF
jgi:LemA protein